MKEKEVYDFAYFEGMICPIEEANVNIRTHALQYGTGCFEGIMAYQISPEKFSLVKCLEHYQRMKKSANILGMKFPLTPEKATEITIDLFRKNKPHSGVYIRPVLYKSSYDLGPKFCSIPEELAIYMIPLGDYLDTNKGLKATVSSWRRISDNAIPTRAKATGSYVNSALAKTEAIQGGFDEAIFLNEDGTVAEGSAENIFIVKDGNLITTPESSNILEGITRKCILQIANDLGLKIITRSIARTELYVADEVFFCGTGAQVAWVAEIDNRPVAKGEIGPVAQKIQKTYFDAVQNKLAQYRDWLKIIDL